MIHRRCRRRRPHRKKKEKKSQTHQTLGTKIDKRKNFFRKNSKSEIEIVRLDRIYQNHKHEMN